MDAIFWFCAGLVLWCYGGYPAFMMLKARMRPQPLRPRPGWTPGVSVVLAVRDEDERLEGRVANLLQQDYPSARLEVLIVSNGSRDGSEAVARELAARDPRVRALTSPGPEGKAGALNRGVEAAGGEVILFADARQRFEPDVTARLVEALSDPGVGASSGRLRIGRSPSAAVRGVTRYWQVETALRLAESRTGSVVGATGAVYAIRRELYDPLPPGLILDDLLTPLRIAGAGYRVVLEPEAVAHDDPAPGARAEFRRKLRTMIGNLELLRVEPRLLDPRANPILGRYVSHKLLRLATPLFLLGMLLAAILAGGAFYRTAAVAQLAFYALGALGLLVPVRGLALPAGFLLAHAAALAAIVVGPREASAVWKR